jgi:anti-sigma factor RsiW
MNDKPTFDPCADYEIDIVERIDGTLPEERMTSLRTHLDNCSRCREWQAHYERIDQQLALSIKAPALPEDFEMRLRRNLRLAMNETAKARLKAASDREYRQLIGNLRRNARGIGLMNAIAATSATAAGCVLLRALGDRLTWPANLTGGIGPLVPMGLLGVLITFGALIWTATHGNLRIRSGI